MSGQRIPGPLGAQAAAIMIDAGTLVRAPTPRPGPLADTPAEPTSSVHEYSIQRAVAHLDRAAHASSQGRCARYVREAIEAGGLPVPPPRPLYAKDYGPTLENLGFVPVATEGYSAQTGDIAVIEPPTGRTEGHIQMFNGQIWVSDFRQRADIYPGPAYRNQAVPYVVYRHRSAQ
jgi:hypothetical protein